MKVRVVREANDLAGALLLQRKYMCSESSEDGGHSETRQGHRGYREALVVSIIQCPAVVLHYSSVCVWMQGWSTVAIIL